MRCAIVLMTHPGIGQALLQTVHQLLGSRLPLPVEAFELGWHDTPDDLLATALQRVAHLDQGAGVLVMTDLYGASPSNLAARVTAQLPRTRRVAGANLAMLLRVLNYPDLALDAMTLSAADAARNGVLVDNA